MLGQHPLEHRTRRDRIAGEIARQCIRRFGRRGSRPRVHHLFQFLTCLERTSGVEQIPPQLVPEVVKRRSELERFPVLLDCLADGSGQCVGITECRVEIRELCRVVERHATSFTAPRVAGVLKRLGRLLVPPEFGEDHSPVNVRLDVLVVQSQRGVETPEGAFRLIHEMIGESKQVVRVGEGPSVLDQLLEQVDGPVIILQLEMLLGSVKLLCRANFHAPPCTTPRNRRSLPRCLPRDHTQEPGELCQYLRRSSAHHRADGAVA